MPSTICDRPISTPPDTSGPPSGDEIWQAEKDLADKAARDILEQTCKDAPFIPEDWCGPASDIIVDTVESVINGENVPPPELQWNLESS